MTVLAMPVTSLDVVEARRKLDRHEVGALIGVSGDTVLRYVAWSEPGGRYEDQPFPAADDEHDGRPAWSPEQAEKVIAWKAARPGRGVGGGQPSHRDYH